MSSRVACVRTSSTARRTRSSTSTTSARVSGSSPCRRDRSMTSCTRWLSREASICMRSAKWRTWSGSSLAASTASASSDSAPTGVLSSWLTFATKSRRTTSTRRSSARSSMRTRIAPVPRGATRTRSSRSSRPSGGRRTRISCSRAWPSSATRSIRWVMSGIVTVSRLTRPRPVARALDRSTRSVGRHHEGGRREDAEHPDDLVRHGRPGPRSTTRTRGALGEGAGRRLGTPQG